jgi:hypothetical protein
MKQQRQPAESTMRFICRPAALELFADILAAAMNQPLPCIIMHLLLLELGLSCA